MHLRTPLSSSISRGNPAVIEWQEVVTAFHGEKQFIGDIQIGRREEEQFIDLKLGA